MIKVKLLGLLSFLFAVDLVEMLQELSSKLIEKGTTKEWFCLFHKYDKLVSNLSLEQKMQHYQVIHRIKDGEIQKLKEYMRSLSNSCCSVIIGNIKEIIREWEESEKSINLPNEIGQQLLDILVLADLDPDAAFARLKAECLNPENVESFLNSNGANLVSLSDFVPMERKEKFKVKFDLEGKDSDFTANLQACARIVWNNPRLRRKFEEILNLFGRRCDFTVSGATIYKYGYFEESEPRSKRARIES